MRSCNFACRPFWRKCQSTGSFLHINSSQRFFNNRCCLILALRPSCNVKWNFGTKLGNLAACQFSEYWRWISYHLNYGLWTHRLKSCWLFCLEYHARESVSDTHGEYRQVETSASSGVGRAGPQTYHCSYRTVATPSQCLWRVRNQGGYFEQYLGSICM